MIDMVYDHPPMKVFLSWSGEYSHRVAMALHDWLPMVINAVEPFVSSEIEAGARWQSEVAEKLKTTSFGILCITAENQHSPWLNFEAGALAKAVEASHVVPLAIDVRPAEIQNPLGQFQAQKLTKEGMSKIASAINSALEANALPAEHIEKAISMWWPELESQLRKIDDQLRIDLFSDEPVRSERDLLEEILDTVRGIARGRATTDVRISQISRKRYADLRSLADRMSKSGLLDNDEMVKAFDRLREDYRWLMDEDGTMHTNGPEGLLDFGGSAE